MKEESNVISGGYLPEYGRTMGGVLNAVTKTGSNEFHGGAFSYWSPGGLASAPRTPNEPIQSEIGISPLSSIWDIGADVGGPIIKDKLWFYVGFDYSAETYDINRSFYSQVYDAQQPGCIYGSVTNPCVQINPQTGNPVTNHIPGMDQHYLATAESFQALGNLTYALNANNTISATFITSQNTNGGPEPVLAVDPSTGGPQSSGSRGTFSALAGYEKGASYDTNLHWSTEFDNKRVLVDTIAAWHHQTGESLPADGSVPGGAGYASVPNVSWNQNSPYYHGLQDFEPGFNSACKSPNPANVHTLCPTPSYATGGFLGFSDDAGRLENQVFDRYVLGSTLTYLFQALGHHVVKVGLSAEWTVWDDYKGHSGGTNIIEGAQALASGGPSLSGFGAFPASSSVRTTRLSWSRCTSALSRSSPEASSRIAGASWTRSPSTRASATTSRRCTPATASSGW